MWFPHPQIKNKKKTAIANSLWFLQYIWRLILEKAVVPAQGGCHNCSNISPPPSRWRVSFTVKNHSFVGKGWLLVCPIQVVGKWVNSTLYSCHCIIPSHHVHSLRCSQLHPSPSVTNVAATAWQGAHLQILKGLWLLTVVPAALWDCKMSPLLGLSYPELSCQANSKRSTLSDLNSNNITNS